MFGRLFLYALAALMFMLFLRLGFWQLGRMEEKADVLADIKQAQELAVLNPDALPILGVDHKSWQAVVVTGSFTGQHWLLDAQIHQGKPGYKVISALDVPGLDTTALLDRGWIAETAVSQAEITVQAPEKFIVMTAPLPAAGVRTGPPKVMEHAVGHAVVNYPTLAEWQALTGQGVYPLILRLHPEAPQGFQRNWRPAISPPERHLGYAVQWFTLAATLLILTLVLSWKQHRTTTGRESGAAESSSSPSS